MISLMLHEIPLKDMFLKSLSLKQQSKTMNIERVFVM